MPAMNPYLNFKDSCEEAFEFYRSVFGGEFMTLMRMGDADMGMPVPDHAKNLIMHVSLPIGNNVLMGSDAPDDFCPTPLQAGNNFSISISAESRDDADRIYNALSEGGTQVMPMQDMFWGAYWGMLTDKFGINWMVDHSDHEG
ncbi:MAG: glyoxalase/bleomycin resistance protein/dioxygenase [Acidobacteria bacterium OLB17]|nr:MAG: glyoxalase/bleomycin resistance protein/dioxygenase [Acidobacteria bacterium OLB17]MCZ2390000.1 VOC family protein [Acidobacteriota bacterium]